jgi:hypothetical protein
MMFNASTETEKGNVNLYLIDTQRRNTNNHVWNNCHCKIEEADFLNRRTCKHVFEPEDKHRSATIQVKIYSRLLDS